MIRWETLGARKEEGKEGKRERECGAHLVQHDKKGVFLEQSGPPARREVDDLENRVKKKRGESTHHDERRTSRKEKTLATPWVEK